MAEVERNIISITNRNIEHYMTRYWRYSINRPIDIEYNGLIYRLTTDLCVFRVNRNSGEIGGYYGCYNPQDRIDNVNIGSIEFYVVNRDEDNRNTEIIENNRDIAIIPDSLPNNVLQYFRNMIVSNLEWDNNQ
jgi:hypothetical protein